MIVYAAKSKRQRIGVRIGQSQRRRSRTVAPRNAPMAAIALGAAAAMFGLLVVRGARIAVGGPLDPPRLVARSRRKRFRRAFRRVCPIATTSRATECCFNGTLLGRHPIWMADMRFPLDLIWLEQDGRVTGVLTNVPICSVPACPTGRARRARRNPSLCLNSQRET